MSNRKFNVILLVSGVILTIALWFWASFVVFRFFQPIDDMEHFWTPIITALITITICWIPICKNLRFSKKISDIINRISLGPFNKIKLPLLNKRQHQVIWIALVILILQFLIPPWMGYLTLGDGEPYGPSYFVGFHVIQPYPEEAFFYEMSYFCPEIDWKFLSYILLGTIACSLACMAYFGLFNKTDKEKLN